VSHLLISLTPAEQFEATRLLARCRSIEIEAGRTAEASEIPDAKLLVIEKGTVQVARTRPGSGRPLVLGIAAQGSVLLPLFQNDRLGALTKSIITVVPTGTCTQLLEIPAVAGLVVDALLDTLSERQETLANTHGPPVAARLRETLFQLARLNGKVRQDGVEIQLPLTHELLARMVGAARETVTSALAEFEREGILTRGGDSYLLTVPPSMLEPPAGPSQDSRSTR
jgi:CRP-like cAMP-binding protein